MAETASKDLSRFLPDQVAGMRVLVVENHDRTRASLARMLRAAGAEVECAADGASAFRFLDQEGMDVEDAGSTALPFSVVIADDHLPNESGVDVAEAVRRRWGPEEVGLVLLSSMSEESERSDLQGEAHLLKPFTALELGEKLETVIDPAPAPHEAASSGVPPVEDVTRKKNALRVLVAEDNRVNQQLIQRLLENQGHEVTLAENGVETVAAWKEALRQERAYDLILMDVQMPEVSGYEATRQIREAEAQTKIDQQAVQEENAQQSPPRVPIVALTARVMEKDRQKCREVGMDAYLAKPIELEDLEDILNSVASSSASVEGSSAEASPNGMDRQR